MSKAWKGISLAGLMLCANANAEMFPSGPTGKFWRWAGNYVTGEALYAECVSLATKILQNPSTVCGTGPYSTPAQLSNGWWRDYSQPDNTADYTFYYFNAVACGTSPNFRYFPDINRCIFVSPVTTPVPASTKDNGPSCPANPQDRQPKCGNPISPGSGTKVQQEVDYIPNSNGLKLELIRTYNGGQFSGPFDAKGLFGSRWSSSLDRKVSLRASQAPMECFSRSNDGVRFCELPASGSGQSAVVSRPDGKLYIFNRSGNQWISDVDVNERLVAQYDVDGLTPIGWTLTTTDRNAEQYDANGRLVTVTAPSGEWQKFTYSTGSNNDTSVSRLPLDAPSCSNIQTGPNIAANLPVCITDSWGRQMQFEYDSKQRVSKVIDPAGEQYQYQYDGLTGGCVASDPGSAACFANNLTNVTYPGSKTRKYHYNEENLVNAGYECGGAYKVGNGFAHLVNSLTGITDENGSRYASWKWDCSNRPISSEHAGGVDKITIDYGNRASDGSNVVAVTSTVGTSAAPQNIVRNYSFKVSLGVAKVTNLNQPCEGCNGMQERSYDSNNNVTSSKDWLGSKTVYTYDGVRNLETSRTEAHGTALARTTSTSWHATMRLPSAIAEPLRITSFTYDADGKLLTKTIQATTDLNGSQGFSATTTGAPRTWTNTYNTLGQLLTSVGPGTSTTMTYDGQGNLSTVTNAANHVTTYSNYDMNGRAGRMTDPNGLATDYVYGPRGWLESASVGGEVTSYTYDGVGNLKTATMPDGSSLTYQYDAAHRLTGIADSYGNNVTYTLDLAGNQIGEQTRDAGGTLTRNISRIFDTLNGLKQITGAQQ